MPVVTEVTGLSGASASGILAVYGIANVVGSLLGGRLADANAARALVLDSDPTIAAGTKLDLTNNVLVVRNGTLSGIRSQVAATFAGGTWNGIGGIASATAAADAAHNTALGVASNATLNKTSFAGVTGLTSAAVFVKYTYYGDNDLSGNTTLDDFTLFLNGYQNSGNTWSQGDYDYSGLVTLDDFTLFLKGYQNQGAPL
jgi:hypothetical protein